MIIAPDGRDAMIQHAEQLQSAGIPFVFDPGQGLPMFDGDELKRFVAQATWVAVNDYEGKMLAEPRGDVGRRCRPVGGGARAQRGRQRQRDLGAQGRRQQGDAPVEELGQPAHQGEPHRRRGALAGQRPGQ